MTRADHNAEVDILIGILCWTILFFFVLPELARAFAQWLTL